MKRFLAMAWLAASALSTASLCGGCGSASAPPRSGQMQADPLRALILVLDEGQDVRALPDDRVERLVATHATLIASAANIARLKDDPEVLKSAWFKKHNAEQPSTFVAATQARVTATPIPGTLLIEVRARMDNSADSALVANAIASSYVKHHMTDTRSRDNERISLLTKEKRFLQLELDEEVNKQLRELEAAEGALPAQNRSRTYLALLERESRLRSKLERLEEETRQFRLEQPDQVRQVQLAVP